MEVLVLDEISDILQRYEIKAISNELEINCDNLGHWVEFDDLEPILKELNELRKEKARKEYLIYWFGRVLRLATLSDAVIDAAIAKSENAVKLD